MYAKGAIDASYLGEAGILFNLTRQPVHAGAGKTGGSLPGLVSLFLVLYFGLGLGLIIAAVKKIKRWRHTRGDTFLRPKTQFSVWLTLLVVGTVVAIGPRIGAGLVRLFSARLFLRVSA